MQALTDIARLHRDLLQAQPLVARGERVVGMWMARRPARSHKIPFPSTSLTGALHEIKTAIVRNEMLQIVECTLIDASMRTTRWR